MWQTVKIVSLMIITTALLVSLPGCTEQPSTPESPVPPEEEPIELIDRESKIPPDQENITPEMDILPPILHSAEYAEPVPMLYPINTAGAEDSGVIVPDGNTFYVWFTPDPSASLQEKLADGVTGIYVLKKVNGAWQKPERVVLQDPDKQSLDGCTFVQGNKMWFCTARTGVLSCVSPLQRSIYCELSRELGFQKAAATAGGNHVWWVLRIL